MDAGVRITIDIGDAGIVALFEQLIPLDLCLLGVNSPSVGRDEVRQEVRRDTGYRSCTGSQPVAGTAPAARPLREVPFLPGLQRIDKARKRR